MSGPLSSLKFLNFFTLLPGPFASLLLADMDAEVLRIESPTPVMVRPVLIEIAPGMTSTTSLCPASPATPGAKTAGHCRWPFKRRMWRAGRCMG
ncbi:MAG: carnitine dehydratase [Pseudomonas sp.]|nr:carnitine dehydratase [Pseudomonas sp.]